MEITKRAERQLRLAALKNRLSEYYMEITKRAERQLRLTISRHAFSYGLIDGNNKKSRKAIKTNRGKSKQWRMKLDGNNKKSRKAIKTSQLVVGVDEVRNMEITKRAERQLRRRHGYGQGLYLQMEITKRAERQLRHQLVPGHTVFVIFMEITKRAERQLRLDSVPDTLDEVVEWK